MYTTLHMAMEACVSSGYIDDAQGRLVTGAVAGSSSAQGKGKAIGSFASYVFFKFVCLYVCHVMLLVD